MQKITHSEGKLMLRDYLIAVVPPQVRSAVRDWLGLHGHRSYAQHGEDMVLRWLLKDRVKGFYVDVGAYHPIHLSNTYYFYRRGWSGLNIDATPGSMKAFERERARDFNVEAAISCDSTHLSFHVFDRPTRNTFDRQQAQESIEDGCKLLEIRSIETRTLTSILDEYLVDGQQIDFLSVDAEGMDLQVLQSVDWTRYRPRYILVECLGTSMDALHESDVYDLLSGQGYEPIAKTVKTVVYGKKEETRSMTVHT